MPDTTEAADKLLTRIDPQLAEALAAVPKVNGRVLDLDELAHTRDLIRRMAEQQEAAAAAITSVSVETHEVLRADDPPIGLRLFRPIDSVPPLPALLWFHGGGQVLGYAGQEDAYLKRIAAEVECIVISVNYRLAPEAKSPAAALDGIAAYKWVCAEAGALDIDPIKIGIAGASGGGCIAAATVLLIRDRGEAAPLFQSLNYPMLDDRGDTRSSREVTGIGIWDRETNRQAWTLVLGDASDASGRGDVSAVSAPARAATFDGLPPTCIIVGELDVFRDEDLTYATRLIEAGVATELHVFSGAYHAWDVFAPDADLTKSFFRTWFDYLRRAFQR